MKAKLQQRNGFEAASEVNGFRLSGLPILISIYINSDNLFLIYCSFYFDSYHKLRYWLESDLYKFSIVMVQRDIVFVDNTCKIVLLK